MRSAQCQGLASWRHCGQAPAMPSWRQRFASTTGAVTRPISLWFRRASAETGGAAFGT